MKIWWKWKQQVFFHFWYFDRMFSRKFNMTGLILEMGPDPTRAYFWLAVNKRLTQLQPGYFPTWPKAIFLTRREKIEKFDVFRGNFRNSNPNHKWLTWPYPTRATKNWSKIFDPDPSLANTSGVWKLWVNDPDGIDRQKMV